MAIKNKPEYLTSEQLAAELQISGDAVRRLRRRGSIPAIRVGYRTIRYRLADVAAAMAKDEGRPEVDRKTSRSRKRSS
jgi:excisionase family DNA binding protein